MSQSPETQYSGSQKKEWNTKDGKKGNGKGATIPISIGNEVGMEIAKQCS